MTNQNMRFVEEHLDSEVVEVATTKYPGGKFFNAEDIYWELGRKIGPRFSVTSIATALSRLHIKGVLRQDSDIRITRYAVAHPVPCALDDDVSRHCAHC